MTARSSLLCAAFLVLLTACQDGSAWAEHVQASSQRADRAIAEGDLEAAREALDALVDPAPGSVSPEDRRVVAQDACYRRARLELSANAPEAAVAWADRGLALGTYDDVFTANLLVARGQARERLGRATDAAADYHEALLVNESLLDRVLEGTE